MTFWCVHVMTVWNEHVTGSAGFAELCIQNIEARYPRGTGAGMTLQRPQVMTLWNDQVTGSAGYMHLTRH